MLSCLKEKNSVFYGNPLSHRGWFIFCEQNRNSELMSEWCQGDAISYAKSFVPLNCWMLSSFLLRFYWQCSFIFPLCFLLLLISDSHFGTLLLAFVQLVGCLPCCENMCLCVAGELLKLNCPLGINSYLNLFKLVVGSHRPYSIRGGIMFHRWVPHFD